MNISFKEMSTTLHKDNNFGSPNCSNVSHVSFIRCACHEQTFILLRAQDRFAKEAIPDIIYMLVMPYVLKGRNVLDALLSDVLCSVYTTLNL